MPRLPILLAAAGLLSLPGSATAGPFALVGDRQLRQDVDLLKAEGLIRGPVDSWPLPWVQINGGLDAARDGRDLDPAVMAAVSRLERLSDLAAQRASVSARLDVTNGAALARDFGTTARADVDTAVAGEINLGGLSVTAGVGARTGRGGNRLNYEPNQVAISLGNFALYGGYSEQWFGPGHDGALLFSNSARPFPKIGVKKLLPSAIDLPVARLFGPIRFDLFVGVLDDRRDFSNSGLIGTRVSFQPGRGVEIGLNRAQQLCGDGRPCGWRQISRSFVGTGGTAATARDYLRQPGNQLAGFDISYTRRLGRTWGKIYVEAAAEELDSLVLKQFGRQVGVTWSGPWGGSGGSWQANVEYADTLAADLFSGTPLERPLNSRRTYPGSFYNDTLYLDGLTYRGRPVGYWTDGDSRNLAGSLSVTDTKNRRWYGSARWVRLNLTEIAAPATGPYGFYTGAVGNRVSSSRERFGIATAGVEWPTLIGDVRFEARYQSDEPGTPGRRSSALRVEAGIRQRF